MKKMGFYSVVALVIGSQVGSGVFMLPASLASIGVASLFGWLISGAGAIMLALVFAQLCLRLPNAAGPHAYVEAAFGKNWAFFVGWAYWLVSWVSSIAVIIAAVGYLLPIFGLSQPLTILTMEILLLLGITLLNLKGVSFSGSLGFLLTLLKCIPLILIPIAAFFFFDPSHFSGLLAGGTSEFFGSIHKAALLTIWGFIGLETVTVATSSIDQPQKIIPRAVIFGTLAVAILYLLNSVGIMGVVPLSALAHEAAPYAVASKMLFGNWANWVICWIASIACIGTLNAWILTSGQIAYRAAKDGLFPSIFGRANRRNAPTFALIVAFFGSLPFLILTLSQSLVAQVNFIIDLSVTAFLFIYLAAIISFMVLLMRERCKKMLYWVISVLALLFCVWALFSVSPLHLLYSSLFIFSGLPIYLFQKKTFKVENKVKSIEPNPD